MIITFVQPSVSWNKKYKYLRLTPLIFAKLKALTPSDITCKYFDTRIEDIDYNSPTDLVVISFSTLTAVNAYKIADKYRSMGIKVVLGGMHVDLIPEEAKEHADVISLGEAELIWHELIEDFRNGNLKSEYKAKSRYDMTGYTMDYSIFKGKHYFPIKLIETSRGCCFNCSFCSQAQVYKTVTYRPVDEIIKEIQNCKEKFLFFTDDNLANNQARATEFLQKLKPLKKKWLGYFSINNMYNEDFVKQLKDCGCIAVGIGFESVDANSLKSMNKVANIVNKYDLALQNCIKYDIIVQGTFLSGTPADTLESVRKTFDFANSFQFFAYTFFNIFPFPKTPIYNQLKAENKLIDEKWWLKDNVNFYDTPLYFTDNISLEEMKLIGKRYWIELFYLKNIFKRFWNSKYKLKTRLFILLINLYLKYIGHRNTFL